jgi:hypothetical protein
MRLDVNVASEATQYPDTSAIAGAAAAIVAPLVGAVATDRDGTLSMTIPWRLLRHEPTKRPIPRWMTPSQL